MISFNLFSFSLDNKEVSSYARKAWGKFFPSNGKTKVTIDIEWVSDEYDWTQAHVSLVGAESKKPVNARRGSEIVINPDFYVKIRSGKKAKINLMPNSEISPMTKYKISIGKFDYYFVVGKEEACLSQLVESEEKRPKGKD